MCGENDFQNVQLVQLSQTVDSALAAIVKIARHAVFECDEYVVGKFSPCGPLVILPGEHDGTTIGDSIIDELKEGVNYINF